MEERMLASIANDGYDGRGLGRYLVPLGDSLRGAALELLDSHTMHIGDIPKRGGIEAVLGLYENGEMRLGLAVMVHANSQHDICGAEKRDVLELYRLLGEMEDMQDCSTEFSPFSANRDVVVLNRKDNDLLQEKLKGSLTMGYMAPAEQNKGYHTILIGMEYTGQFPEKVKELFEKMGAEFRD